MKQLDERLVEQHEISEERLMENAAYHLADFLKRRYPRKPVIRFYIGPGNNGVDAAVAARRLYNWGFHIQTVTVGEPDDRILQELEHIHEVREKRKPGVVVDGLLGYGMEGEPRPEFAERIEEMNELEAETISVDIPTGLDPDNGEKADSCVEPRATVTMAFPFEGMDEKNSGEIWVADISVPREELERLGALDFFLRGSLMRFA